ncbi:MAG: carboxypeptidase-like regulatory domain-containing protein [Bacteroidia bacterium]|nr:carboxypeptidase-like regulatory domain-containing protein [Bacteroidia bacterium]
MKNIILIIVLIGYFSTAHCQTFKGTVYDRSTDSPLNSAIVYISGTSVGTYTDTTGSFELDISKYSSMPITISLLGYNSVTLSEHSSNKRYQIYLTPKINELKEVTITAYGNENTDESRDENRVAYLKIFKHEFLGETQNGMNCEILNKNDIFFSYNPESSALEAYSLKPILIHNKALGYSITYYLDKFIYIHRTTEWGLRAKFHEQFESMTLKGNYLFKDDLLTLSESEKRKVEARRRSAYLGSRMHFFRLLYTGNLIQKGKHNIVLSDNTPVSMPFSISSNTTVSSNSLVIKKDSLSGYLKNKGELSVKYRMRPTTINIKVDSVYFEKDGYFDPVGVEFSGEMPKQRIGDLLPFEYLINQ